MGKVEAGQKQEPGTSPGLLHRWQGHRPWIIRMLLSQAISRKQDSKWSNQDTNQHPYRMLESPAISLSTMPHPSYAFLKPVVCYSLTITINKTALALDIKRLPKKAYYRRHSKSFLYFKMPKTSPLAFHMIHFAFPFLPSLLSSLSILIGFSYC